MPDAPPTRDQLVNRILDLHHHDGDPYRLFVTEAMRTVGFPMRDPEPAEDVAEEVRPVVLDYFRMVAAAAPFFDVLGPVYSEVSSRGRRSRTGQFFTPWELSLLMVQKNLGDWQPAPNPDDARGLWTVLEPAAGAGAMILALLSTVLERHGPEALRLWDITAVDVDQVLARTCALQVMLTLASHNWAVGRIQVIHGNSLSLETFGVVLDAEAALEGGPGEQLELLPRSA